MYCLSFFILKRKAVLLKKNSDETIYFYSKSKNSFNLSDVATIRENLSLKANTNSLELQGNPNNIQKIIPKPNFSFEVLPNFYINLNRNDSVEQKIIEFCETSGLFPLKNEESFMLNFSLKLTFIFLEK